MENLWSFIKRKLYLDGKQYVSNDELWNGILVAAQAISESEIKQLISSMNNKLVSVISRKGGYANFQMDQLWLYMYLIICVHIVYGAFKYN